ncbi:MAG: hypothetical protein LBP69_09535 [Treponema sp.]|jgi:hypothetical protein|nr:hypothetical protein [Treponema sp.]
MHTYEIVEKYLRENGYAGLKNCDNDCSCFLDKDYADCDYFGGYYYCHPMRADGTTEEDGEETE